MERTHPSSHFWLSSIDLLIRLLLIGLPYNFSFLKNKSCLLIWLKALRKVSYFEIWSAILRWSCRPRPTASIKWSSGKLEVGFFYPNSIVCHGYGLHVASFTSNINFAHCVIEFSYDETHTMGNQIDHICIRKQFTRSVWDVRTRRGADIAPHHHLWTKWHWR